MRTLSFAVAVVMALGGAGLAGSASAAPGAPMGVNEAAAETATPVGMHRRMMHRRHMMHHRMMHRRRMMHHRRMHRM